MASFKESLHRGLSASCVEQVLLRAGWPAEQVRRALNRFSDLSNPDSGPQASTVGVGAHAFMYVVMFATLILSGYNLGDCCSN